VSGIYRSARLPQALLIPLTLSKRLHSLYMLRLFNDPFAMLFLYAGVLAMTRQSRAGWTWGCRLVS
jgi:alpha-1,3-mannosyltransferase